MHGEQQSWHDWDPSKYETKTQPKVQTVDRLQNWSGKDKQNKKWLWFLEEGEKESPHSQNNREWDQEKGGEIVTPMNLLFLSILTCEPKR